MGQPPKSLHLRSLLSKHHLIPQFLHPCRPRLLLPFPYHIWKLEVVALNRCSTHGALKDKYCWIICSQQSNYGICTAPVGGGCGTVAKSCMKYAPCFMILIHLVEKWSIHQRFLDVLSSATSYFSRSPMEGSNIVNTDRSLVLKEMPFIYH